MRVCVDWRAANYDRIVPEFDSGNAQRPDPVRRPLMAKPPIAPEIGIDRDASLTPRQEGDSVAPFLPMSKTLQYLTDERGEKTAVVLALSDYEKLLEDLEDLAVVAERRDEPIIPHEQFVGELKRDGLL